MVPLSSPRSCSRSSLPVRISSSRYRGKPCCHDWLQHIRAIWSVSIIALGGGAIGMYLIHKKHSKERNICMSSFIPTLVGISEPAIFAANMRYSIIPFICACIGAGCGGAFVKLF